MTFSFISILLNLPNAAASEGFELKAILLYLRPDGLPGSFRVLYGIGGRVLVMNAEVLLNSLS